MKAGIRPRSARLSQRSFAISEASTEAAALRVGNEPAQRIRRIGDVGVGEQQIARRARLGMLDALPDGPQLAGPSRRQWPAGQYGEPIRGARVRRRFALRDLAGAVAALVVDQDDVEGAGIVLAQERREACAITSASSRAGTTAVTAGQVAGAGVSQSSRTAARQKKPRASIR